MTTVIEIVKAHLVAGGFDGLVLPDAECGCRIEALCPCEGQTAQCRPAFLGVDPRSPDEWAMYPTKEAAEASKKESA